MNRYLIYITLMISFLLSGCASPYAKFYTENNYASSLYKENNKDLVFLADGETPIVYTTDNIDRDVKIMKSKNYVPIGSSSFNGELYNGLKNQDRRFA